MVLVARQLDRTEEYLVTQWNNPYKCDFVRHGTLYRIYKVINNIICTLKIHHINIVRNVFSIQIHEDIDHKDEDMPLSVWNQFLDWYHEIIYKRGLLKETNKIDINVCIKAVMQFLFLTVYSDMQIRKKNKHD